MVDPILMMLSKILMMPVKELMYPRVIFSLLLPVTANIVCFYGLHKKLRIFGSGSLNDTISIVLAVLFSYFTIKLEFLGYAVACMGIAFLYFRNDFLRLGFILGMIGLYYWLPLVIN